MYQPIRPKGPTNRLIKRLAYNLLRLAGCEGETCFDVKRLSWSPWRSEHRGW